MKNGSRLFQTALSIYSKWCVAAVVSLHGLCSVANNHVSKILLSHVYFVVFSFRIWWSPSLCRWVFSDVPMCLWLVGDALQRRGAVGKHCLYSFVQLHRSHWQILLHLSLTAVGWIHKHATTFDKAQQHWHIYRALFLDAFVLLLFFSYMKQIFYSPSAIALFLESRLINRFLSRM